MADTPFKMKAHDLLPSIQATLGYAGSAAIPNLTGCVVTFIMRKKGAVAPKVKATATIISTDTATVQYDWQPGDTSDPGDYTAEWQVTDVNGRPQTFPTDSYNQVTLYADLDSSS